MALLNRGCANGNGKLPRQSRLVARAKALLEAHGLTWFVDPLKRGFSIKPAKFGKRKPMSYSDRAYIIPKKPLPLKDYPEGLIERLRGLGLKRMDMGLTIHHAARFHTSDVEDTFKP